MRRGVARAARRPGGIALCLLTWTVSGCVSVQLFPGPPQPLVETVVHGESGPKVLLLDIDGLIAELPEERGLLGRREESMVARVREQLERAREDSLVRALLLRINSPGGTATASDILYREILEFKKERGMPVVAQLMGVATSGGYYVAMAADWIVAHPTTVTGSIGVIFLGVNFVGLMEKLGIENQTLRAGKHKDAGSVLRRMSAEERARIQSVLDDMHARFKQVVVDGRADLGAARVDALADGSIYSAEQAVAEGLVDGIGYLEDAVGEVEKRAGLESSRVVSYHRPREWRENLYTRAPFPTALRLDLGTDLPRLGRPGFLYLWLPARP